MVWRVPITGSTLPHIQTSRDNRQWCQKQCCQQQVAESCLKQDLGQHMREKGPIGGGGAHIIRLPGIWGKDLIAKMQIST